MKQISLKIQGMSCSGCASKIERELSSLAGVKKANINFAVETGEFEIESEKTEKLVRLKIVQLGYVILKDTQLGVEDKKKKNDDDFNKFIISIALASMIFSLAMWPLKGWPSLRVNWYLQLFLCIPIWAWIGFKFQKSLVQFFTTAQSNMNTLIGLGTSAAFFYSAFVTIFTEYSVSVGLTQRVYFEAVGFIISFVYLGQYFEGKAKKKTMQALNSLFELSAKKAFVLRDAKGEEVNIEDVEVGELIRVKPGEKIPVDGEIAKGSSAIDESMITGEAMPITKGVGDNLFAGTINGQSVIEYKATKVGLDTFLSQIIKFVEKAQGAKPEIQKYADKVSSIFTPVVMLISIVTFGSWFFLGPAPVWGNAVSNFIAVLVIACPCALGLATPTAVVVATGRASLKGLLIGGGDIIEKAVEIDTIIFDKTGTITQGKPSVIESILKDHNEDVLREAASIEQFSEHPLSRAIVQYAKGEKLELSEPSNFMIVEGKGISSHLGDSKFLIGNEKLLREHQVLLDDKLKPNKIGSFVYISKNNEHIGTLVIGDKIKESSLNAISKFRERGIETWMITGDNKLVAQEVATELGVDHFIAEALPLEKSARLEALQLSGKTVAMIGDGVNDAPALAKADLSMAMGTGTDVAINASDVTIVGGDLLKVLEFIELSKGTMKIIKQNLFLSMIYNALLIPIAAGALVLFDGPMMPPVLASIAMALSSLCVVSNSLRIRNLV